MKYAEEFRDPKAAKALLAEIARVAFDVDAAFQVADDGHRVREVGHVGNARRPELALAFAHDLILGLDCAGDLLILDMIGLIAPIHPARLTYDKRTIIITAYSVYDCIN